MDLTTVLTHSTGFGMGNNNGNNPFNILCLNIISYLWVPDLISLSTVSKHIFHICRSKEVNIVIFRQIFNIMTKEIGNSNISIAHCDIDLINFRNFFIIHFRLSNPLCYSIESHQFQPSSIVYFLQQKSLQFDNFIFHISKNYLPCIFYNKSNANSTSIDYPLANNKQTKIKFLETNSGNSSPIIYSIPPFSKVIQVDESHSIITLSCIGIYFCIIFDIQ